MKKRNVGKFITILVGLLLFFAIISLEMFKDTRNKMVNALKGVLSESSKRARMVRLYSQSESKDLNNALNKYCNRNSHRYTKQLKYLTKICNLKTKVITKFDKNSYLKAMRDGNFPCRSMTESKGEAIMRSAYLVITGILVDNVRPNWCTNPLTNRTLEYDLFDSENKFLGEYNGIQHYDPSKNTEKNSQVYRDMVKRRIALDKNYKFLEVPYIIKPENIGNMIHYYIITETNIAIL